MSDNIYRCPVLGIMLNMNRLDVSKYDGYTKGPWTDYGKEEGDIYGADGKFPGIIQCDSGVYGPYDADRRLIIDAPLILEALKQAYDEIDRLEVSLANR